MMGLRNRAEEEVEEYKIKWCNGVTMELKIREQDDNFLKFVISDTVPSFVITIRRVLIANVPKMAIEDVEFHLGPIRDNTGKEFDGKTTGMEVFVEGGPDR